MDGELRVDDAVTMRPYADGPLAWLADTLLRRDMMPSDVALGERFVDAAYDADGIVVRWTRDGRLVRAFGGPGDGPGELRGPSRVHQYADTIFVGNVGRIDVFAPDGTFLRRALLRWQDLCEGFNAFLACGAAGGVSLADRILLDSLPAATQVGRFGGTASEFMHLRLFPSFLSDSLLVVTDLVEGRLSVIGDGGVQRDLLLPVRWMREARKTYEASLGPLAASANTPTLKRGSRLDDRRLLVLAGDDSDPKIWLVDVEAETAQPVVAAADAPGLDHLMGYTWTARASDGVVLLLGRDTMALVTIR